MDLSLMMEYLKPELLVLIPVCWGMGLILKNAPSFSDKAIPPVMGVVSIVMAAMWVFAQSPIENYQDALMAMFTAIAQGVIASLLSNLGYDKLIHPLGSATENQGGDDGESPQKGE